MHFKFSAYNDRIILLFSGNTYPYGSRASQILKLGVSEFYLTVPNSHVKSRVCFMVCHGIAKGGDCKFEYI